MTAVHWLGFAAGLVLLLVIASSVVKTLLIPRATVAAMNAAVSSMFRPMFATITRRIADVDLRERILSAQAPLWLITLLALWLAGLIAGFGLLLWPWSRHGLPGALTEAGSSLFTLGFIRPSSTGPTVIVFLAGASGLAVVALLIAYLPVLYAAFNRRETLVTMLEALAGAPPWGPELLARQALIGDIAYLRQVYDRWTAWAADIAESHTSYRTLVFFRSPDPSMSWLLGLLAVLDAAALHLSLRPRSAPPEARPALRVGYITMRRLAQSLGLAVSSDPHPDDPIALTREDFDAAVEHLRKAGWRFERTPEEAWPHFHGWRVNYEAAAYALAYLLDLPPALWSGPRPRRRPAPELPKRPPHREPKRPPHREPPAGQRAEADPSSRQRQ